MTRFICFALLLSANLTIVASPTNTEGKLVWKIGESDDSPAEFALAPSAYKQFLESDFGWEDGWFLLGTSEVSKEWPYALPGPADRWGGTSGTAGWRSHTLNALFELANVPDEGDFILVVDLFDFNAGNPPLVKITLNGHSWKYFLPNAGSNNELPNAAKDGHEFLIEIPISNSMIKEGGNELSITSLQGSWFSFDQLRLEGPASCEVIDNHAAFIRNVEAADYEIELNGQTYQPLLLDIEQVKGTPELKVRLDGTEIFSEKLETGRYIFEAPMPEVEKEIISKFEVFVDGKSTAKGEVVRKPFQTIGPSGYVNTMQGTAHSRWMIAPGPWMPFSMVKLSPDNQNKGWQAGYDPIFESIGGFSHIHEWTLSGLLTMPTTGPLITEVGDQFEPFDGYRSLIDKSTEEALLGYYKVHLTDYDIWAELTSTTRCGFQRYTFPEGQEKRVLLDLYFPSEYDFLLDEVKIEKVGDHKIQGYSKQRTPNTWAGGITQEYTIHFVAEFDQPIKNVGVWTEDGVQENIGSLTEKDPKDAGMYVEFDTRGNQVVQLRTGISYVSIENAQKNLVHEITDKFGWNFDAVVDYHRSSWDSLLSRIKIQSNDRREKVRFYTNMYRSFCSRNTYSDVDGKWVDANEQVQQLDNPDHVALGCDAFWNTFWNLNQLWNLAAPEWSNRWVNSQLAMYDIHGWLAKGPAGMEYIPVMVAEHEIPLIVGAYQMGIRDFDEEKAFQAMKKMQTTPGEKVAGGYAGNRDLETYLEHHFVPFDKGRFSNSLEYSFDDWAVSQMAKSLGKEREHQYFNERSTWWKNTIDREIGFARLKKSDGSWAPDFDPFQSGANHHYVEGNSWQLTFFVPQDVTGLADLIGKDRFLKRLEWGFGESNKWRFNAPNDQYWDYPVMQGNQQSMHFSFLFNWVGKPWLTQKWSRSIIDRYYGHGLANAYLGDEDQGQMSAWFIMAALGLFQTDGGCSVDPIYEIGSPIFQKVEINLGNQFGRGEKFVIEAINTSRKNVYVQSAALNGKTIDSFKIPVMELLKGGRLELEMGPSPNMTWGVQ